MSKAHLTQLWQWLSIACVLYLAATVISLQGGTELLGRLFGDKGASAGDNGPAVAYFGAIIGGGLFLLASLAFLLHTRRHGTQWHSRIPVVWLTGLDTGAWEGKVFQICVLLLFIAVPSAGILRCMEIAESGDICEQDTNSFYKGSETTLLWPAAAKVGNQIRLRKADSTGTPCSSGVQLFPRSLTPIGFYGVPVAAGFVAACALFFLVRTPAPPPAPDQP